MANNSSSTDFVVNFVLFIQVYFFCITSRASSSSGVGGNNLF